MFSWNPGSLRDCHAKEWEGGSLLTVMAFLVAPALLRMPRQRHFRAPWGHRAGGSVRVAVDGSLLGPEYFLFAWLSCSLLSGSHWPSWN